VIKNPSVILFSACFLCGTLAGLHSAEEQEMVKSGVDLLAKTAVKILGRMKEDTDHGGAAADDSGA
jgi:hypothetical protein